MQEDFLHYIWQYQKFSKENLQTVNGKQLQVLVVGEHNTNSGPDFFNSKLIIDDQIWVGTVELHLKSSDWYVHQHQNDMAYQNVILHVVWEDDVAVFDANQNELPTLVLKSCVDEGVLKNYKNLLQQKNWINCENQIHTIDVFTLSHWKEKLVINRLERKSRELEKLVSDLENDWEALLFLQLAKCFGLRLNADQFLQLAKGISFKLFKKQTSNLRQLEALLYGQANLLNGDLEDAYFIKLKNEYAFLKQKYQLQDSMVKLEFFRLRPAGFPTIRLSQFAMLYHAHQGLFAKVLASKSITELEDVFTVVASDYWNTHYTFGKVSAKRKKTISKSFVELLIVNAIIPIKFMYAKSLGATNFEDLLGVYMAIKPEKNTISNKFKSLKVEVKSAADSQAFIELKTMYCDKLKCLQCEIGNKLLYS